MENQEKMITIKEKDKVVIIEYETKALSKLCHETDDDKVRKLIECYQQTEEGDIEEFKNAMLKLSELGEDQKLVFKTAIIFITNDSSDISDINESDLGRTS